MAKSDNTNSYDIMLSAPGTTYFEGTIMSFDPANGVLFQRKKPRSSKYLETFIPSDKILYLVGSVGGQGMVGFADPSSEIYVDSVSSIKHLHGDLLQAKNSAGDTVIFKSASTGYVERQLEDAPAKEAKKGKKAKADKPEEGKKGKKIKGKKVKSGKTDWPE